MRECQGVESAVRIQHSLWRGAQSRIRERGRRSLRSPRASWRSSHRGSSVDREGQRGVQKEATYPSTAARQNSAPWALYFLSVLVKTGDQRSEEHTSELQSLR